MRNITAQLGNIHEKTIFENRLEELVSELNKLRMDMSAQDNDIKEKQTLQ